MGDKALFVPGTSSSFWAFKVGRVFGPYSSLLVRDFLTTSLDLDSLDGLTAKILSTPNVTKKLVGSVLGPSGWDGYSNEEHLSNILVLLAIILEGVPYESNTM